MENTTPYKRNGRKQAFLKHETEYSTKETSKHNTEKHKDSSESSDNNQKKKKYKPYE